jgi:hypothetical protein
MVLSKRQERELEQATLKAESREDMKSSILVKMKSVTNADESVCVALLEDHSYVSDIMALPFCHVSCFFRSLCHQHTDLLPPLSYICRTGSENVYRGLFSIITTTVP